MISERYELDVAVIGAGVIGLAVARAFALAGREVIVFEAAKAIGTGISSRNSEVIHGGIYYPTGSAKAACHGSAKAATATKQVAEGARGVGGAGTLSSASLACGVDRWIIPTKGGACVDNGR